METMGPGATEAVEGGGEALRSPALRGRPHRRLRRLHPLPPPVLPPALGWRRATATKGHLKSPTREAWRRLWRAM